MVHTPPVHATARRGIAVQNSEPACTRAAATLGPAWSVGQAIRISARGDDRGGRWGKNRRARATVARGPVRDSMPTAQNHWWTQSRVGAHSSVEWSCSQQRSPGLIYEPWTDTRTSSVTSLTGLTRIRRWNLQLSMIYRRGACTLAEIPPNGPGPDTLPVHARIEPRGGDT